MSRLYNAGIQNEFNLYSVFGIPADRNDINTITLWRKQIGSSEESKLDRELRHIIRDINSRPIDESYVNVFNLYNEFNHPMLNKVSQRINQLQQPQAPPQEIKENLVEENQKNKIHLSQMTTGNKYQITNHRQRGNFEEPERPEYEPFSTTNPKQIYTLEGQDFQEPPSKSNVYLDRNMKVLAQLILDLKKDVRRVSEAQSLKGAENWVKRHNSKIQNSRNYWHAIKEDINEDGIDDVVIHDSKRRARIINGWTTKQQDPLKALYIDYLQKEGTPSERKKKRAKDPKSVMSYQGWLDYYIDKQYDENHPFNTPYVEYPNKEVAERLNKIKDANAAFYRDTGVRNIYKTHTPRRMSANQVFIKYVTKQAYDAIVNVIEDQDFRRYIKAAASIITVSAKLYQEFITKPVDKLLESKNMLPKDAKRMKDPRTGENYYSALCKAEVTKYLGTGFNQGLIDTRIRQWLNLLAGTNYDVPALQLEQQQQQTE